MAVCTTPGLWDQVRSAAGTTSYLSKQQWRAYNLLILCELVVLAGGVPDMSFCTVDGLWNQVKGTPPFISEQEFMAENINLLCLLLLAGGGGGGGGGNFRAGSGTPAGASPGALRTAYADDDTGVIYVQNSDGTWPTLP